MFGHALGGDGEGRHGCLALFLEADSLHVLNSVDLLGGVLLVAVLVLAR